MPRVHSATWLKVPFDLALTSLTLLAVFSLASHDFPIPLSKGTPPLDWYLGVALPVHLGAFLFAAVFFRLYRPRPAGSYGRLFLDLLKVTGQATLIVLAVSFYLRDFSYSRLIFTGFFLTNPGVLFAHHFAWMARERWLHRRGIGTRRCLVVGRGELARAVAHRLETNPWAGLTVVGFVGFEGEEEASNDGVVGELSDLPALATEHRAQEVIVAVPFREMGVLSDVDRALIPHGIGLRWVPDLEALATLHRTITDFQGLSLIDLRGAPVHGWSAFVKRSLDIMLSAALLCLLAPVMAVIAASIRIRSGSPVLFRQDRVGLDGRVFPLLKFRTMVRDAERETGPVFAGRGDQRATGLGRFLRRTSLDELPQLINVLVGQMSLVGPRPERPVFIEEFRNTVPRYMLRHRVKAGLTGWAQVNGWRGRTSLQKRIQFDLHYIRNWTVWLDLKILFLTLTRAWSRRSNAY